MQNAQARSVLPTSSFMPVGRNDRSTSKVPVIVLATGLIIS
jgi:hypothetical protein